MAFLGHLRTWLLKPSKSSVAGLVALHLFCGLLLAWRRGLLAEGRLPDGVPFYSPGALAEMLRAMGPDGLPFYAVTTWTVDMLFPVAYGGLMALLLFRGAELGRWWSRAWLLPAGAVAFDLAENAIVGYLALTFPGTPAALAWAAALASGAKWVLFSASLICVVVLGVREPRKHGWWSAGMVWLVAGSYLMTLGPVPVLGWLLVLAAVAHTKWLYLGQYVFFLRFPLAVGLVFTLLPQISRQEGPGLLVGNLFVLESALQVFSVALVAGITAMALMSAARMVYLLAPERTEISIVRSVHMRARLRGMRRALLDAADKAEMKDAAQADVGAKRSRRLKKLIRRQLRIENQNFLGEHFPWAGRARPLVFALLALPVLLEIRRRSVEEHALFAAVGLLAAVALGYGILKLEGLWLQRRWDFASDPMGAPIQDAMVGLSNPVGLLGLLALAFYVGLGLIVSPTSSATSAQGFPAILYVFLILIALTWLLTLASLRADVARVPVVLAAVVILFGLFQLSDSDHRYEVMPNSAGWDLPSATAVVRASLQRDSVRRAALGLEPARDYVTLVAASGGGIKASLWTARVLEALSAALGPGFGSSIVLMSTNSGGSVGGMYFTEAFAPGGPPSAPVLEEIVAAAGASSLSATVWGMAYPDLWRFVSGGLLLRDGWRTRDRGWAMDRTWEAYRHGFAGTPEGRARRLGDWVEGVQAGWRPAHIFNATVVETGAAMRFSTVDLSTAPSDAPGSARREFDDLFPRGDVDLATAARLSASFPWVSPIAQGWMHPDSIAVAAKDDAEPEALQASVARSAFHLTDGGFFDNFGVFSAIEFLLAVGPDSLTAMGVDKVALVQIRASAEKPGVPRFGGLSYSVAGPIIAMNSVRTSSQIGRNAVEVGQLADFWATRGVELCSVLFEFREAGPLSWHLSTEEQERLHAAWNDGHRHSADGLGRFLDDTATDAGDAACP